MRTLLFLALFLLPTPAAWAQCVQEALPSPHDISAHSAWGSSLAVDGDALLVGARLEDTHVDDAGAAWFYRRTPAGWVREARVFDAAGVERQGFGSAVALERDLAAVARPRDGADDDQPGAVHIYRRVAGAWLEEQVLDSPDGFFGFGEALVLAQRVLYVGRSGRQSGSSSDSSGVDIFERSGGVWTRTQHIAAPTPMPSFGSSLAVHGDRLAVGSLREDTPLGMGAVYLFERDAAGVFVQRERFPVPEVTYYDSAFGASLALDAERLYVGGPHYGSYTHPRLGAVFVYAEESFGWVLEERLGHVFADDYSSFSLGVSVAVDGPFVYASSSTHVHAFQREGSTWTALRTLVGSDPLAIDRGRLYSRGFDNGSQMVVRTLHDDFTRQYCTCTDGAACNNPDGTAGCRNSTYTGARLDACGSPSVAADDLTLAVSYAPARAPAFLFMGGARARVPFGDGERCVAPGASGLFRYPPRVTDPAGHLTLGPGLAALSLARFGPAGALTPGSTWHFQVVLRDPAGPCDTGLATTQGLEVVFAP